MSIPATVRLSSQTFAAQLANSHRRLLQSDFYLGGQKLLDKVIWICDGRADHLVVKGQNEQEGAMEPSQCELAMLSAIVRVDRNDFWLTSDAGYSKPSTVWSNLVDVKPSCVVCAPDLQPVKSDYAQVVANLQELQNQMTTPGYQLGKGFYLPAQGDTRRFKLHHALFEVSVGPRAADTTLNLLIQPLDDEQETSGVSDEHSDFAMNDWPLTHEETREELQALKATHRVVPVPAYDVIGNLIKPNAYRQSLQDAIVEMHFNMAHWAIAARRGKPANDVFVGDIEVIRVLVPPRPSSSGLARKRVVHSHLDPNAPIQKKTRNA